MKSSTTSKRFYENPSTAYRRSPSPKGEAYLYLGSLFHFRLPFRGAGKP